MALKTKTLLVIGDYKDYDAYKKFINLNHNTSKIHFRHITYAQFFAKNYPKIKTQEVIIFPFFPFKHWDKNIETKFYKGVYANKTFIQKFADFWKTFENRLDTISSEKILSYVNHPRYLTADRDKEQTKDILAKHKIAVPKTIKTRNITEIKKIIKRQNLYIKVRYGAMGKGITYLSKDRWETNFRFRNNKIVSKKSDTGWTFIDVTSNTAFLKELLKQDIVIEPEISPYLIDGEKFDLRLYLSYGNVNYIYPRTNDRAAITTNISQGATGQEINFLDKIPKRMLQQAKTSAIKAAKAMNLQVAGIDIMFDNRTKKPIILEVNAFPGFPKTKSVNLSKKILDDIKKNSFI